MKYLLVMLSMVVSMCLLMLKRAFENNLVTHEVMLNNEKKYKPVNMLFISDIHRRSVSEKWLTSLPETDIAVIGGDITEKGVSFERVRKNAALLAANKKTYFVFGNNDEEVDKTLLTDILENQGITVLENESVKCHLNEGLVIAGVGDINYKKDDISKTMAGIQDEDVILISHDPRITKKLNQTANAANIKLILSGHTHGGQIRLFGFGPYQKGSMKRKPHYSHLISNGYGTTLLPMRLGAKSEVHLIRIV
ncbi:metallophosphoesterase [Jeotgalibacillus terrae]|uniref:Metallophosphoesterase n=1 Tax=Jeotgalibacillus terrae TaxID=587735 RepID=A0ABW5ZJ78_9BACL|nr:metallophosphoesterase [Jeotgalibacillus terrae]MBM7577459.1 putative MPP superfamily phosphohydrolase [Jeotgalibacillus terrae]